MSKYVATIGIETHVQLKTATKLFAAIDNDAREAEPNTLVSPICFGLPGVLPVLNQEAVKLAVRAGLALNAEVAHFSKFDRKHYFYPDLPKGYQITQYDQPTVGKGQIEVPVGEGTITVRINRAHLEEDAGKLTHPAGSVESLVDLNRAGTPLLEIVSEPDMHSPEEARAYAEELYLLMKFASISDVDLYHGNMRFDVNVSLAVEGSDTLGTRSEVKNLNSFRNVERAVEYEIERQSRLLDKGEAIVQETLGWDEAKQRTASQRSKEEAQDYRYFPDPDLPPVVIEQAFIEEQRQQLPPLPRELRERLTARGLTQAQARTLLSESRLLELELAVLEAAPRLAQRVANWLTGEVRATTTANFDWNAFKLDAPRLMELASMVEADELSATAAKEVLGMMMNSDESPRAVAESKNLLQVSDDGALTAAVKQAIEENPAAVADVQKGEEKAIGFLTGQVMKAMGGRANPGKVQQLLRDTLLNDA